MTQHGGARLRSMDARERERGTDNGQKKKSRGVSQVNFSYFCSSQIGLRKWVSFFSSSSRRLSVCLVCVVTRDSCDSSTRWSLCMSACWPRVPISKFQ